MIVIKHGKNWRMRMRRKKCPSCNSIFLYSQDDIKESYERINAYESEFEYNYVKCPECGEIIKLN